METWRHGLHRPGRCCIKCHIRNVLDYPEQATNLGFTPPAPASTARATSEKWTGRPIPIQVDRDPGYEGRRRRINSNARIAGQSWWEGVAK